MTDGNIQLPVLDGYEVRPGMILIGEPTPVIGTNTMRALANVFGELAVIELTVSFAMNNEPT